jgi:ABC-type amino acid transport system permease subunit
MKIEPFTLGYLVANRRDKLISTINVTKLKLIIEYAPQSPFYVPDLRAYLVVTHTSPQITDKLISTITVTKLKLIIEYSLSNHAILCSRSHTFWRVYESYCTTYREPFSNVPLIIFRLIIIGVVPFQVIYYSTL